MSERVIGAAAAAGIGGAVLSGCGGVSPQEKDSLRDNLAERKLNVISISDEATGVTAEVSFGSCIGTYNADVTEVGKHDDSLDVILHVPGSDRAVQTVTVDHPSLESLQQIPAIADQCFSNPSER